MNECTGNPSMFFRPLSAVSSMMTRQQSTTPPAFVTSSQAADKVPPVARRSSTINTFCPFLIAPHCISKTSDPYSSWYSTLKVSPGSLFFFLIGTQAMLSSEAIVKLNRKPRASRPTTTSIDGWFCLTKFKMRCFRATHVGPSARALKMSLK
jgi:hypothetical protein